MKKFAFVSFFTLFSLFLQAQDFKVLQEAFSESYSKESAGKYGEAVNALKTCYKADSYEMNLRLGWLTYLQGDYIVSASYYNKAIELMPYAIEPRLGLVLPNAAIGNWNVVIAQYQKILEIDPNNTIALYKTGLIFYNKKEYTKAAACFEKVVNLYPFDHDSLLMLGWSHYFLGKSREAKVLFNKVLLYNPKDESALEGLSLIR